MTEVDEVLQGEHLQMAYLDYIEAVARITDESVSDIPNSVISLKKK